MEFKFKKGDILIRKADKLLYRVANVPQPWAADGSYYTSNYTLIRLTDNRIYTIDKWNIEAAYVLSNAQSNILYGV